MMLMKVSTRQKQTRYELLMLSTDTVPKSKIVQLSCHNCESAYDVHVTQVFTDEELIISMQLRWKRHCTQLFLWLTVIV